MRAPIIEALRATPRCLHVRYPIEESQCPRITPTQFESVRDHVSPEEWETRVNLAACYRLIDKFGMTDLIYNHITRASRAPRTPADQPLRPALQGDHRVEPGEDRRRRQHPGEARHRLRHQQVGLRDPRRDPQGAAGVKCVIHTHTRAGIAVSCDAVRTAADVADLDALRRTPRLSRLRRPGGRSRRARAAGARPRPA